MVVGREIEVKDMALIAMEGVVIECVENLCYLGTVIVANCIIDKEIDRGISNASKVFGALKRAVFKDAKSFSDN